MRSLIHFSVVFCEGTTLDRFTEMLRISTYVLGSNFHPVRFTSWVLIIHDGYFMVPLGEKTKELLRMRC